MALTDSDWTDNPRAAGDLPWRASQQDVQPPAEGGGLSSVEAELYTADAVSAEALATAAYARDAAMTLERQLCFDSSASLGISQRAGIGKVRDLRIGFMYAGIIFLARVDHKNVLGTKNLADVMSKLMAADLSRQHFRILNMKIVGNGWVPTRANPTFWSECTNSERDIKAFEKLGM